jgi:DNA-binding CsgD family transcriptional regulator
VPRGKFIGTEKRMAILRLALAGRSKIEVAQRLGISTATVDKYWPTPPKKKADNAPIGNKAP